MIEQCHLLLLILIIELLLSSNNIKHGLYVLYCSDDCIYLVIMQILEYNNMDIVVPNLFYKFLSNYFVL